MTRLLFVVCVASVACGDDGGGGGPGSGTVTGTCDPASTATTSVERIDEALANGLIDLETSIELKAFAEFDDARLTTECRGDDSAVYEGESLDLISENWDALSPNARAILGPFTWPPVRRKLGEPESAGEAHTRVLRLPGPRSELGVHADRRRIVQGLVRPT